MQNSLSELAHALMIRSVTKMVTVSMVKLEELYNSSNT